MRMIYCSKKRFVLIVVILLILSAIAFFTVTHSLKGTPTIVEPIYQGANTQNTVSITVNVDWGEDVLPQMLTIFQEKEVKATFFVTGRFAEKYPELVKDIAENGHEIGNHGYSHPHHDQLGVEGNLKDIQKGEKAIESITGIRPILFAPAYGEHGETCLMAAEQNENKVILWTADTIDWQTPPPDGKTLVNRVTGDKLHNGTIILMHPKEHTIEALPEIIDTIRQKGYMLSTVSHMLETGVAHNAP